ncbi:hypothetical protein EDC01DRAFT_616541, partial [Geopyxis carbonaria]
RTLTNAEKKEYIRAVKCMHTKPGIMRDFVPSSLTLYEDFAAVHKLQTPYIHWEAQFLPWHRYYVWVFETRLKKDCGFKGDQPYWDYARDSGKLNDSPIFDPEFGFGGDGLPIKDPYYSRIPPGMPPGPGGGCQTNGPFKDWTIHIATRNDTGPREDRCLTRSINEVVSRDWCNQKTVDYVQSQTNFRAFTLAMQGDLHYERFGLHLCGHYIVAGPKSGSDVYIGSVDPLFYLHHTNLDRIWWEWQQKDPKKRLKEVSGPLRPGPERYPGADYSQFPDEEITLKWKIDMGPLAKKEEVGKLMDINSPTLGYRYEY